MSNSRSNGRRQERIPQHRDTIRHSVKLLTHTDTHDATPRTEPTIRHDEGEDHQVLPLMLSESVARQLAVRHAVRVRGLRVRAKFRRLRSPPDRTPAGFCWSGPLKPKAET